MGKLTTADMTLIMVEKQTSQDYSILQGVSKTFVLSISETYNIV